MPTVLVGVGGTGRKIMANISRKVHTVFCIICVDGSESMSNNRQNAVQRRNESVVCEVDEKMRIFYTNPPWRRSGRIWVKSPRNKHRSTVNEIRKLSQWLNQKQDIIKKAWQDKNGIFYGDAESNENLTCAKDRYSRNTELFLEMLYQKKTEQNNRRTIQYRLKNGLTETENQSNSEQRFVRLSRLQNQSSGMFFQGFSCWRKTIQRCDRISGKTDTIKVRLLVDVGITKPHG